MNNASDHSIHIWTKISIQVLIITIISFQMHMVQGQASVSKTSFQGRDAFTLENDQIQVSMLIGGGYIGEVRFKSSDSKKSINPMRVPHYKTIDPQDYNPTKHDEPYGGGGDRKVMASYMGHFLCFPYLGGSNSQFEKKLGFEAHGEAVVVKWNIDEMDTEDSSVRISASADLPLTSYKVRRQLTLNPNQSVVLVEEEVENMVAFDRPYQWVQHITFGDPFVEFENNFVDAPVSKIAFNDKENDPMNNNMVQWPIVKTADGSSINVSVFDKDQGEGDYKAWQLDPDRTHSWFTMYNKNYNVLIGYIFPKKENPWISDWQENGLKKMMPWNGKAVARGLLLGTSPFTSGVKRGTERGPIFDTPTFDWIGAKEKKKQSYLIFLVEIEEGFKGISNLSLDKNEIVLIEKETNKQIRIKHQYTL